MTTPLLAITYKTEDELSSHKHHQLHNKLHHKQHSAMEKRLINYYMRLYREQTKGENDSFDVKGDADDYLAADADEEQLDARNHELRDQITQSGSSYATSLYNKITISKDYAKDYLNQHKIWKPITNSETIMNFIKSGKQPGYHGEAQEDFNLKQRQDSANVSGKDKFDDAKFLNYLHLPKTMGPEPLPPLIYHTSCEVNGRVFLFGGASTVFQENGAIHDLSNYSVDGLALPKPINSRLLNNPTVLPNKHLYIISAETKLVIKPQIFGDIPPPLLSMSGSKITDRHIFYYGGFEILNKIKYNSDTGKIHIKKSVKLNNSGWVLDVVSLKFRKFELIAHPNAVTRYPLTVPRFGHSSCAINLSKHLKLNTGAGNNIAATIFIAGGFRQDIDDPAVFKTIKDLWKVELSIVYKGKHGFVQFGDNVLATPIPGLEGSSPMARAFHYAEIFDSTAVQGNENSAATKKNIHNPNKIGIARPSSPTASVVSQSSSSSSVAGGNIYGKDYNNELLDLKLIVHGGTDGEKLLGDVWWFDFDDEIWSPISTYFHDYDENFQPKETISEAQLKRAGHCGILVDKYLYLIGGAMPSDFGESVNINETISDISPMSSLVKSHMQEIAKEDDHDQRLFVLNLSTQTWLLTRYFHGVLPLVGASKSLSYFGNTGLTVTQSNSKVFVVGGQIVPHSKFAGNSTSFKMNILNNSIGIFEFPLGSPLIAAKRDIR